jgi:hypothetical protein
VVRSTNARNVALLGLHRVLDAFDEFSGRLVDVVDDVLRLVELAAGPTFSLPVVTVGVIVGVVRSAFDLIGVWVDFVLLSVMYDVMGEASRALS